MIFGWLIIAFVAGVVTGLLFMVYSLKRLGDAVIRHSNELAPAARAMMSCVMTVRVEVQSVHGSYHWIARSGVPSNSWHAFRSFVAFAMHYACQYPRDIVIEQGEVSPIHNPWRDEDENRHCQ